MCVDAPYLEGLGPILKERIDAHKQITVLELRAEYPELTVFPYSDLWHEIMNLDSGGYIRVEWNCRDPICYSVE